MPGMRPNILTRCRTWCPSKASTRRSRDIQQGKFNKSKNATNDSRHAPDQDKDEQHVRSRLDQRPSETDPVKRWAHAHPQGGRSRRAAQGTLPQRDSTQGRGYSRRQWLARRRGTPRADGLARTSQSLSSQSWFSEGVSGTQIHRSRWSGVFVDESAESIASMELVGRVRTDET